MTNGALGSMLGINGCIVLTIAFSEFGVSLANEGIWVASITPKVVLAKV